MSPSQARGRGGDSPWTGSMVFSALGFVAISAIYLEASRLPTPAPVQIVVADIGYFGLILFVGVLATVMARRTRGSEQVLWGLLACAYAVLIVSEVYWLYLVISMGSPPPPVYAPFQVLHGVAALIFLAVVGSLTPLAGSHPLRRARQLLDVVSFGIVVYVIAYFLEIVPFFSGIPGSVPADALVAAVYQTWAVLMLAGLAWPLVGTNGPQRYRRWETLLGAALALYAVAIAAWPLWFAGVMDLSATGEQAVLDIGQMLSHYILAFALVSRMGDRTARWVPRQAVMVPSRFARTLSYTMVGFVTLAMPVLIALAITSPQGSTPRAVFMITSVLLAVLTVARTALTAVESGRLFRRSLTDPLTSLYNHRHFHESLQSAVDRAVRFDGTVAVLALDLDGFDEVNNRYGHPAGDDLLRQVATALRATCGPNDLMCRVGGDEFAAVLVGADAAHALETAARIRRGLATISTPDGDRITVSTGVACYPEHGLDADTLVRLADGAAYWVKRHGKDHALVYDPSIVVELDTADLVRAAEQQAESGIVRALAAAVDARYAHSSTHSVSVAGWSTDVARRLGLSAERIRFVETAALLHDVGMIAVGEDVVTKPAALDAAEIEQVRRHAPLGERIVAGTTSPSVLTIIRHHHERWDGTGYPDGLQAVAIPLEARILAVCVAYDAMTSPRPHRPAMSVGAAVAELRACAGTQFDPSVVDVFLDGLGALGRLPSDV